MTAVMAAAVVGVDGVVAVTSTVELLDSTLAALVARDRSAVATTKTGVVSTVSVGTKAMTAVTAVTPLSGGDGSSESCKCDGCVHLAWKKGKKFIKSLVRTVL